MIIWRGSWSTWSSNWICRVSKKAMPVAAAMRTTRRILVALLLYGYATGTFSSRALERASYDSVAFRYVTANTHPDHDTINSFRKRFLKQIEAIFVQVLGCAREMGMLKLGTVSLDGTKVHANASRHSAMSYGHAKKLEAKLKAEVAELLKRAEAANARDLPEGMNLPEELCRREARLAAIATAKAKIEARVKAEAEAAYAAKLAAREQRAKQNGKRPGGRPPAPPSGTPKDTDQVNFTDEDSRIMPVPGGGFEQAYNAQAAVDTDSMLVVATAPDAGDQRQAASGADDQTTASLAGGTGPGQDACWPTPGMPVKTTSTLAPRPRSSR